MHYGQEVGVGWFGLWGRTDRPGLGNKLDATYLADLENGRTGTEIRLPSEVTRKANGQNRKGQLSDLDHSAPMFSSLQR